MLTNSSTDYILETHLKEILSDVSSINKQMLQVLEQNIQTQEELNDVQNHLQDYETIVQLAETMKFVFKTIMRKLPSSTHQQKFFKSEPKTQNYEKLEQAIQKHEQEIRMHIRTQHEMKIQMETIIQELEESEQVRLAYLKESTQIIQKLKKENYQLSQQLKYYLHYNKQYPTPLTSRRDSGHMPQKAQSRSAHHPNGAKVDDTNQKQAQLNSVCQLLKMAQKESQKSLTYRQPLQYTRNKSFSVGISKQSTSKLSDRIQANKNVSHHLRHKGSLE